MPKQVAEPFRRGIGTTDLRQTRASGAEQGPRTTSRNRQRGTALAASARISAVLPALLPFFGWMRMSDHLPRPT